MRFMELDSAVQIFLTVLFLINTSCSVVECRTTKSRTRKTTKEVDTTTLRLPSLLDMPQNDIYNNQVDEDLDNVHISTRIPTLAPPRKDRYSPDEQSMITWNLLQQNNAKNTQPKYNRKNNDQQQLLRGPPGPRGPAGAEITKDDMVREFKKMVKQAANKKARKIIKAKCPSCDVDDLDSEALSNFYPGVQDKVRTINRSPTVFTTKLLDGTPISPGKVVQLSRLQLTGKPYDSLRGVPAEYGMDGKFRVDKDGIYQFTTTLNFHSSHRVEYAKDSRNNYIEVRFCLNDLCTNENSKDQEVITQFVHSMDSRQRYFTVQLTAMLQLKNTDYITVNVINSCRRMVEVKAGSLMTGIMLSV